MSARPGNSILPLATVIAAEHCPRGLAFDDAVQECAIGILRARRTFDPAKGKWSVYAKRWCVHFMQIASGCRKTKRAKHQGTLVALAEADGVAESGDLEAQIDARRALRRLSNDALRQPLR